MPKFKICLLFVIAFSVLPAPASLAKPDGFREICRVTRGSRECLILPNRNRQEPAPVPRQSPEKCPPANVLQDLDKECKRGNQDSCGGARRIRDSGCR